MIIGNDWDDILKSEFCADYFKDLMRFLDDEYRNYTVYPKRNDIFNVLKYTKYKDVKAVIIGQDPYHNENQAHGLSFSVPEGEKIPPSLKNIFKELNNDLKIEQPSSGYLKKWADEGVLLLNAVLTVRSGEANSHKKCGWEIFTDKIIEKLDEKNTPIVFILWGNYAKNKASMIKNKNHLILEGNHPSPLSAHRGFFNKNYFSRANEFLASQNIEEIDWNFK